MYNDSRIKEQKSLNSKNSLYCNVKISKENFLFSDNIINHDISFNNDASSESCFVNVDNPSTILLSTYSDSKHGDLKNKRK